MDEIKARVREMIRASDIPAEVAAALQDSLRYSIRLHTTLASDEDLAVGATKIGGRPDLPRDRQWPEWRGAPLNFLAQIGLAGIAEYDSDGELSHEGMLSFFFDYTNWVSRDVIRKARSPAYFMRLKAWRSSACRGQVPWKCASATRHSP